MSIKVIGAGFGRTGTTSLKAALEQLGFVRCYHMQEVLKNPKDAVIWQDAVDGEAVDWPHLLKGYQATVDWPGCTFYQELMEVYPDAKVLLSVRDPERWYQSARDTIYRARTTLFLQLLRMMLPAVRHTYNMIEHIWAGTFENRFDDKAFAIDVFNRHNEAVKAYVPADRLLVFDVREGWGPLCNFLGVDIPNAPFPHLNDKKVMQRAFRYGPIAILSVAGVLLLLLGLFVGWLIGMMF